MRQPSPPRTSGSNSITRPASRSAFSRRSAGAAGSLRSTRITSRASSTGPMPLPIGWLPSVIITSRLRFRLDATYSNSLRSRCAAGIERTLAVGPTGMSSTRCVEPAAIFFDRIDATIWPGESMPSGRSTEIRMSSAGDRSALPPQARQPLVSRTIFCRRSTGSSTSASISIVSAVPAGEVIARDEVFGHSMPCAVTMGTTSIDVRLPGMPPMQCLSTTGPPRTACCQSSRRPVAIIASVRYSTSSRSRS